MRKYLFGPVLLSLIIVLGGCQSQADPPATPIVHQPTPTTVPVTTTPVAIVLPTDTIAAIEPAATPTPLPSPDEVAPIPSAPEPAPAAATAASCEPTPADALGPFYVPNAPLRDSVGQGHVLRGAVRSGGDCSTITEAQLEFWLAGPDGSYADDYRAVMSSDSLGAYRFESNLPPPYSGRPPHIHLRVSAEGYQTLVTQYYPKVGETESAFDVVLLPEPDGKSVDPGGETLGQVSALTETNDLPAPTLLAVPWADRSVFRAGLIDTEQGVLDQLPGASVYRIDLTIAEDLRTITGQEEVLYTNREDVPLDEIYFRLFPNLADGSTTVSNLAVNGQPIEPSYELKNSALRVPLAQPLQPGEQVVIQMEFAVRVPDGEGGNYGTFALADGVLALAHVYPMIAVYDDEGWNVEIAPGIGDVVYADTSFYLVRITAPADQTVVTAGIEIEREETDERQTLTIAAGPMRDFYLAASRRYAVTSRRVGQTTVNSYAPTELIAGAELALEQAGNALESFNRRFGTYPYTEFDVVTTTTFALGVEYPSIVAILVDLYDSQAQVRGTPAAALLEAVVAHEVAHQWFYALVGNDQVDDPWLDEALAQYLTLIYYADVHGPAGSEGFRRSLERRWARVDQADIPIGQAVRNYSIEEYSAIVYGRGPLFIEALSERLGEEAFAEFMRDYAQTYRWGIATGEDFKGLAEKHCNCDLAALFEAWVYPRAE